MNEQLQFDLFDERRSGMALSPREMRQSILGFLASLQPDGIGQDVPVRFRKYQVAAGAFFFQSTGRTKQVATTIAVELYTKREHCFADGAVRAGLLEAIEELRVKRERMEAQIRKKEPHLQSSDDLFSEFRTWDYLHSANPDYAKLRRQMDRLQLALFKGTRLERIREAGAADLLYLAVPHDLIAPTEVSPEWGLLYLDGKCSCTVAKEPQPLAPSPEGRTLFALNIGASGRRNTLFAHGVRVKANGDIAFSKPPRPRLTFFSSGKRAERRPRD